MLLLSGPALGLLLGLLLGGSLQRLGQIDLRFGPVIIAVLLVQSALLFVSVRMDEAPWFPAAWSATLIALVVVAVLNPNHPGILLAGAGAAFNVLVIAANGGMPVDVAVAMRVAGASQQAVLETLLNDPLRVAMDGETRLAALADWIPVYGPVWLRGVMSVGDVLLSAGAGAFIFKTVRHRRSDER